MLWNRYGKVLFPDQFNKFTGCLSCKLAAWQRRYHLLPFIQYGQQKLRLVY